MSQLPLISICIPAYKNAAFLDRLFQSIQQQDFRDFEVVVSDDSPDDEVWQLTRKYEKNFPIHYFKNNPSLGSPANWNYAIKQAKGAWIKIMHDDDWFNGTKALSCYFEHIKLRQDIRFFYAAYRNVNTSNGNVEVVKSSGFDRFLLQLSPLHLLRKNTIGNPSCIIVHRSAPLFYEEKMKWVVDIDYYIQLLKAGTKYAFISQPLVDVGISQEQITVSCFRNPAVELPENLMLIEKYPPGQLMNLIVFDYFWRLFRNLPVTQIDEIRLHYPAYQNDRRLNYMISIQNRTGRKALSYKIISKSMMLMTYVTVMVKWGAKRY